MNGTHVRLRAGNEHYAVPIENVRQVDDLGGLSPVPGAGSALLGVRNFHGQVLPVYDFARVVGIAAAAPAELPRQVVVAEHDGRIAGLGVDEIVDVGPLEGSDEAADADHLSGAVLEAGQLIGIVDVDKLFGALAREAA